MAINIDKTKYFGKLFYTKLSMYGEVPDEPISNEMCLVIFAAEARGYRWQIIPGTNVTEISNDDRTVSFFRRSLPTQPLITQRICLNKYTTKLFLERAGVCTPKGYCINKNTSQNEVDDVFAVLQKPLVVKPLFGTEGDGVYMNINSGSDYLAAIEKAGNQNSYDKTSTDVLIEEQISPGSEYRLIILNGKLLSCLRKTPFFVIGDGVATVEQLITMENLNPLRKISDNLYPQITIDEQMVKKLGEVGLNMSSVLQEGERLQLRDVANIMAGGFSESLPDLLSPSLMSLSNKIASAIPGMQYCGVDIILHDTANEPVYSVIEINAAPAFDMNELPQIGEGAQIADKILDELFM